MGRNPQGWDAQEIARIATACYGGYPAMFAHHGWPERGADMMRKVQTRVAETFGSVESIDAHHPATPA
jgi:hypothetical protein